VSAEAPAEALVNTVNEVGVMGKGIALMFREAFPEDARIYEQACKRGEVQVGRVPRTTKVRDPAGGRHEEAIGHEAVNVRDSRLATAGTPGRPSQ
jgi:hypothetical protein